MAGIHLVSQLEVLGISCHVSAIIQKLQRKSKSAVINQDLKTNYNT